MDNSPGIDNPRNLPASEDGVPIINGLWSNAVPTIPSIETTVYGPVPPKKGAPKRRGKSMLPGPDSFLQIDIKASPVLPLDQRPPVPASQPSDWTPMGCPYSGNAVLEPSHGHAVLEEERRTRRKTKALVAQYELMRHAVPRVVDDGGDDMRMCAPELAEEEKRKRRRTTTTKNDRRATHGGGYGDMPPLLDGEERKKKQQRRSSCQNRSKYLPMPSQGSRSKELMDHGPTQALSFRELMSKRSTPASSSKELMGQGSTPASSSKELISQGSAPASSSKELMDHGSTPASFSKELKGYSPAKSSKELISQGSTPAQSSKELISQGSTPAKSSKELISQGSTLASSGKKLMGSSPAKSSKELISQGSTPASSSKELMGQGSTPASSSKELISQGSTPASSCNDADRIPSSAQPYSSMATSAINNGQKISARKIIDLSDKSDEENGSVKEDDSGVELRETKRGGVKEASGGAVRAGKEAAGGAIRTAKEAAEGTVRTGKEVAEGAVITGDEVAEGAVRPGKKVEEGAVRAGKEVAAGGGSAAEGPGKKVAAAGSGSGEAAAPASQKKKNESENLVQEMNEVVLLAAGVPRDAAKQVKKNAKALGAKFELYSNKNISLCIAGPLDRRKLEFELLVAIARRIPIVSIEYLTACSNANEWLDKDPFLINDQYRSAFDCDIPLHGRPLLEKTRTYVIGAQNDKIQPLLKECGAISCLRYSKAEADKILVFGSMSDLDEADSLGMPRNNLIDADSLCEAIVFDDINKLKPLLPKK